MKHHLRYLGTAALIASSPLCAEDRALIIGVESYPEIDFRAVPQSAADDAIRMSQFAVDEWGFAHNQVSLLVNEAATSANILDLLIDELLGLTTPGDRVLLYYAGIGSRNATGTRVLLAHDSETLLGRIPEDAMSDMLDLIADRAVTVIIDTGFRGEIAVPGQRGLGEAGQNGDPFGAAGDTRTVISAARSGQAAFETAQGGILTQALMTAARGAADTNSDGKITHAEAMALLTGQSAGWCADRADCAAQGLTPMFAGDPSAPLLGVLGTVPSEQPALPDTAVDETDVSAVAHSLFGPALSQELTLAIDGGTALSVGDRIVFRVTSDTAGSLILFDIGPDGALTQIFPSSLARDGSTRIVPTRDVVIPSGTSASGAVLQVRVTPPTGSGTLLGVLVEADNPDLTALLPSDLAGGPVQSGGPALRRVAEALDASALPWSATFLNYVISN